MNKHHNEQGDDEIYLGVLSQTNFDGVGWKSKRQGDEQEPGMRPVFIKRAEVEYEMNNVTHQAIAVYYARMLAKGSGEIKENGHDKLRLVIEITESARDLGENGRALFGFELHANVVPVEADGNLHNNSNFTWLTPMIVQTIRFLLDASFGDKDKVSSEFTVTTPGDPIQPRSIEKVMDDYQTGADVVFPEALDVPTTAEPEKVDFLVWELPGDGKD